MTHFSTHHIQLPHVVPFVQGRLLKKLSQQMDHGVSFKLSKADWPYNFNFTFAIRRYLL